MRRRALRPSFVVTFALGAAAIASGCSSKESGNGSGSISDGSIGDSSIGDSSIGDGGCPAALPTSQSCDLPSSESCDYGPCQPGCPVSPHVYAYCVDGGWVIPPACNPPSVNYCLEAGPGPGPDDAAPGVSDAGPDAYDGGPDVHDGGADGEGQDGGHD
jgi:hypothetical protein